MCDVCTLKGEQTFCLSIHPSIDLLQLKYILPHQQQTILRVWGCVGRAEEIQLVKNARYTCSKLSA